MELVHDKLSALVGHGRGQVGDVVFHVLFAAKGPGDVVVAGK